MRGPCPLPQIPPVGDPKCPVLSFSCNFRRFLSLCLFEPQTVLPYHRNPVENPGSLAAAGDVHVCSPCLLVLHFYSWCCIFPAGLQLVQMLHLRSWCCISVAGAASLQLVQHLCSRCCITAASAASLQLVLHLCSWCSISAARCISAAGAESLQLVLNFCS